MAFVTGAADTVVRLYDEQTRQLVTEFRGGGTGAAGHNSKVMCCKFVDENLILTGGWDRQIKVWDIREPSPIRSIFGPYVSADSLDV
jgi:WD40 repeat protein